MPTPTDTLADEIRETNHRLADTNEAIHELGRKFDQFRVDVTREIGSLRTEMSGQFGTLNANLEGFRGRTETSLAVAKWAVRIVVPVVIGLVGWSYFAVDRAARLEASIVELREHSKDVDQRISRLVELMGTPRKDH
jgi:hypothetical protein